MAGRIGVDVGGTFTDLVFFDERTGRVSVGKGPSDPAAVDRAVRAVVDDSVGAAGVRDSGLFLHGTTVGLNALIERRGARVGLLTTEGFRDVLELRQLMRVDADGEHMWKRMFRAPEPLVARPMRIGIGERMRADGTVERKLDGAGVSLAAASLLAAEVEAIAIVFINSHANPAHELKAAELLRQAGFSGDISLSHQVTGQFREYERTSTTVVDAYVRPPVSGYLDRLQTGLREGGFEGECLITTSSGGCVTFSEASSRPFETVMSGPVAGVVGASTVCEALGIDLAVTADVGGTSFDTALLIGGAPQVKYEGEVVGMPLQTSWVDVRSVGAGGGSIASAERGLLRVGPRSAGAYPGPACYGRGGTEPTVTDAAAILGMLARDSLAGDLAIDLDAGRGALAVLGDQLGIEVETLAQGVLRVAGAGMAGAIRAVTIEVGEDPREGALIAYGGAGPLFASLLADELDIETIVVPQYAGNFSAWGLMEQDVVRVAALTFVADLDDGRLDAAQDTLGRLFDSLAGRSESVLEGTVTREAEFDCRYAGQEYALAVPLKLRGREIDEPAAGIAATFAKAYEARYGHALDVGVEIEAARAIERTVLPRPSMQPSLGGGDGRAQGSARAYSFSRDEWCEFAVIDRDSLAAGTEFDGPAIVQEETTTSYFDVGLDVRVSDLGAMVARRRG